MDILYLLVPMSALLVLLIIAVFAWALSRGQFDDLADEGRRILDDDQPPPKTPTGELDTSRDPSAQ